MPYQITEEPHLIRIVFTDEITPQDLVALDADVAALARNRTVALPSLADFSQVNHLAITYADMSMYAEQRRRQRYPNRVKSAIVATLPVQVGFARMFETLNTNPQIQIQIFATVEAAEV